VHLQGNTRLTLYFIMVVIVALTWASGFDYLFAGLRHLRGRGDFGRADAVRILGSLLLPCAIFAALRETPAPGWPLLAILSLELAIGGLDNLLSHHKKASGALPWGARTLGASALLGVALLLPQAATWLSVLAAAISFAGVTWEFWRGRDYYLDARIRDEVLRNPVPTPGR
jgi:phosphatidylglycerophosphate synthase